MTKLDDDPPLGACPPWCQLPPGHDWEDRWLNGLVRQHKWVKQLQKYHAVELREYEQHTVNGLVCMQEVVLDLEAPTQLDVTTGIDYLLAFAEVMALARAHPPANAGEVA